MKSKSLSFVFAFALAIGALFMLLSQPELVATQQTSSPIAATQIFSLTGILTATSNSTVSLQIFAQNNALRVGPFPDQSFVVTDVVVSLNRCLVPMTGGAPECITAFVTDTSGKFVTQMTFEPGAGYAHHSFTTGIPFLSNATLVFCTPGWAPCDPSSRSSDHQGIRHLKRSVQS
jgi:hypothetical protein